MRCEVLGVGPHETWMVGDNLEWEIVAPQRLGIYAIWHDGYDVGLPGVRIRLAPAESSVRTTGFARTVVPTPVPATCARLVLLVGSTNCCRLKGLQ